MRPLFQRASVTRPAFLLGLTLGGAVAWPLTRPSEPRPLGPPRLAPSATLPAWSWRDSTTPPPLSLDNAASAIAAWSALRGPDGRPPDFATRADALHALLVRLPPEAFPKLLAALAPDPSSAGLRLLDIGFDAWVETDPAAATRWVAAAKLASADLAVRGIRGWSSRDADAASSWACALQDTELAARLAGWALSALARKDPARALALASSRDDAFRDAIFPSIIEPLSKADPAAAVQAYGPLIWNDGKGFGTLRDALRAWALRDPAAALTWLARQPQSSGILDWHLADLARGSKNRAVIATTIATAPGFPGRQTTLPIILSDWANEQPAEALEWLKSLRDPDLSAQLLLDALNRSTPGKPADSLHLFLALPEGEIRTGKLGRTLADWAKNDPAAALAWIRDHPEPSVSTAAAQAHAAILGTIARDEPATAVAEWRAIADPQSRAAALLPIARAWGESDPAAALDWYIMQKSAGGNSTTLEDLYPLNRYVLALGKKDPDAALRWAEKYSAALQPRANEPDWVRLAPYYALAGNEKERAPRAPTADLYTKIQDPAVRTEVLTAYMRDWLRTDPAAAKTWLEKSTALTPAQAAALLTAP